MSSIINSHKIGIVAIFVAIALVGSIVTSGDHAVFAKKSNHVHQKIVQPQDSDQDAQCVSGADASVNCNNVGLSIDHGTGKEAAAQH